MTMNLCVHPNTSAEEMKPLCFCNSVEFSFKTSLPSWQKPKPQSMEGPAPLPPVRQENPVASVAGHSNVWLLTDLSMQTSSVIPVIWCPLGHRLPQIAIVLPLFQGRSSPLPQSPPWEHEKSLPALPAYSTAMGNWGMASGVYHTAASILVLPWGGVALSRNLTHCSVLFNSLWLSST